MRGVGASEKKKEPVEEKRPRVGLDVGIPM